MTDLDDLQEQVVAFKATMVDIANANAEAMRAMTNEAAFDHVQGIVESAEVVFGVYQDENEPDGIGVCMIKGSWQMRAATVEKQVGKLKIDALPCASREQAIAAKQMFGDETRKAN
jgi:hypothetical protein